MSNRVPTPSADSHGCAKTASPHLGLSPGVLAALWRVQLALRKVLSAVPQPSPSTLPEIAQGLADQGLLVTLRTGLGVGIDSPDYLSTLRHSFLICQEGSSGLCVIVDPSFREQFNVAGMPATSSYSAAVGNVPECFVGTIGTVNALVCLLTGTLLQESLAHGIELPPWRSKQALLSKWLPRRFADSVFAPPSFASTLHPALRSSVHGTLSSSPTSVQSWPSLRSGDSRPASSNRSSAACSTSSSDRTSCRSLLEPHTVIKGFSAPQADTRSASCDSPSAGRPRSSALTQQLAAAAEESRNVQLEAQAHWRQCLAALEERQQQPRKSSSGDACSLRGKDMTHSGMLQSLVVSPVHKRSGCSSSLKRGSCSSLKLSTAALKMLPRIYTVKLAAAAAC